MLTNTARSQLSFIASEFVRCNASAPTPCQELTSFDCIAIVRGLEGRMLTDRRYTDGLTPAHFDLICSAIDSADNLFSEGDYMMDAKDCAQIVALMGVLFDVFNLPARPVKPISLADELDEALARLHSGALAMDDFPIDLIIRASAALRAH